MRLETAELPLDVGDGAAVGFHADVLSPFSLLKIGTSETVTPLNPGALVERNKGAEELAKQSAGLLDTVRGFQLGQALFESAATSVGLLGSQLSDRYQGMGPR